MGDEMRRTQRGNNNAYCQDNETSWLDWRRLERHRDVRRFVAELIAFRRQRDVIDQRETPTLSELLQLVPVAWHGVRLDHPDWGDRSHSLAMSLRSLHGRRVFYAIFNAYWEPLTFELPPAPGGGWRRFIDTALLCPADISPLDRAPAHAAPGYLAQPRSVVVLTAALEA